MELVVDANIVMSALISTQGKTFDLLFQDRYMLFAPDYLFDEINKHKETILSKSGLTKKNFEIVLSLIQSQIQSVPKEEFMAFFDRAEKITPDPNDREYFALALKLKCPLWSNDKQLKKQDKVKVYSTLELLKKL